MEYTKPKKIDVSDTNIENKCLNGENAEINGSIHILDIQKPASLLDL